MIYYLLHLCSILLMNLKNSRRICEKDNVNSNGKLSFQQNERESARERGGNREISMHVLISLDHTHTYKKQQETTY